jgi:hypothetical protein
MNFLFDLKQMLRERASEEAQLDHLKSLMKQERHNWESDFDQFSGAQLQHLAMGSTDETLEKTERAKEELDLWLYLVQSLICWTRILKSCS